MRNEKLRCLLPTTYYLLPNLYSLYHSQKALSPSLILTVGQETKATVLPETEQPMAERTMIRIGTDEETGETTYNLRNFLIPEKTALITLEPGKDAEGRYTYQLRIVRYSVS